MNTPLALLPVTTSPDSKSTDECAVTDNPFPAFPVTVVPRRIANP
jgi:hypothetical protein